MKKLNKHLILIGLQLKVGFMALPKILLGTAAFAACMVLFSVGLITASNTAGNEPQLMVVAVVYPDGEDTKEENGYVEQAFNMLGTLDVVKNVCIFENTYNEKDALERLKNQEISAVVVLPDNFISSIVYGDNVPARIVFPKADINNTSAIFREMIKAAATDLSSAQAGIYAVDDVMVELGGTEKDRNNANTYLNIKYLAYALDRDSCFEYIAVDGGQTVSTARFYVATGIVLLFLMSGIICVSLLKSEPKALNMSLKRFGVQPFMYHIYKVFAVAVVFWVVFGIVYIFSALFVTRANMIQGVFALFVLLFSVYAFAGLIFRLAGKAVSGVMALFMLSVVMMFATGCFVPLSTLPPLVQSIGKVLPTYYMFELCIQIIFGGIRLFQVAMVLVYGLAFLVIGALVGSGDN